MDWQEYTERARRTAGEQTERDAVLNAALGLCGEAGEVADIIKKVVFHGHARDIAKLVDEMGDVLWYFVRLCDVWAISPDAIMARNLAKLEARYPAGFSVAASNNREE